MAATKYPYTVSTDFPNGVVNSDNLKAEIARGAAAKFPLRAADLIKAGMAPGPALGAALTAARSRWLDSNFSLDRMNLLDDALDKGL